MPTANAEGQDRIGGRRRKGLGSDTSLRTPRTDTGPRRSPSACSEMLKKTRRARHTRSTFVRPKLRECPMDTLSEPRFGRFSFCFLGGCRRRIAEGAKGRNFGVGVPAEAPPSRRFRFGQGPSAFAARRCRVEKRPSTTNTLPTGFSAGHNYIRHNCIGHNCIEP